MRALLEISSILSKRLFHSTNKSQLPTPPSTPRSPLPRSLLPQSPPHPLKPDRPSSPFHKSCATKSFRMSTKPRLIEASFILAKSTHPLTRFLPVANCTPSSWRCTCTFSTATGPRIACLSLSTKPMQSRLQLDISVAIRRQVCVGYHGSISYVWTPNPTLPARPTNPHLHTAPRLRDT